MPEMEPKSFTVTDLLLGTRRFQKFLLKEIRQRSSGRLFDKRTKQNLTDKKLVKGQREDGKDGERRE